MILKKHFLKFDTRKKNVIPNIAETKIPIQSPV